MDWLIDDGEKVILRCQVIRKSQSKKFENVQRKICSISLCQNIIYDRLQKRK